MADQGGGDERETTYRKYLKPREGLNQKKGVPKVDEGRGGAASGVQTQVK